MKPKAEGSTGSTGKPDKKSPTAAYEELMQFYDNKIEALMNTRNALDNAKPVLTPPSTPPGGSGSNSSGSSRNELQTRSRALLALELLTEMVDDMTMDIVFETHYQAKQSIVTCQSKIIGSIQEANANIDNSSESFECLDCNRFFPAARFASHMDKCMGLSSRRTATRSAASTPNNPPTNYDSSSEQSADRKRRPAYGSAKDAAAATRKKLKRK
ncbi:hypothetical protein GGI15_001021 [Coemansia interrupta]|uniref:SAGA-associated factor 11 n=1 Tax=Coemansia interrupta TaxID=1126814 RepID=A0A9W8HR20_9FUNG|nr:hypothetical protein GGI15_001021 [Coemansia interrupta]